VTHPSLGLPPPAFSAGYPAAADRLRANRRQLSTRTLEIMLERDRTIARRYAELGLRQLLNDIDVFLERLAMSVADDDPHWVSKFMDDVAPQYRRRRVPMDDVINLFESLRLAGQAVLSPVEQGPADRALDAGIAVCRRYRRIAGDARKRNPILSFIYKGA
jgi:hypothetical protein